MNRAMSSSTKVSVSLTSVPIVSLQVPVLVPEMTRPCTMKPSGASTSRTSRMPRWSMNAPMERKTSSKSWRGLPS